MLPGFVGCGICVVRCKQWRTNWGKAHAWCVFWQLWNAAANDEIRLSPPQPRHQAMGLRNSGWLWNYGSHEFAVAVDTVEGRTHKARFD